MWNRPQTAVNESYVRAAKTARNFHGLNFGNCDFVEQRREAKPAAFIGAAGST
jgi:hypothetical protein